MMMALAMHESNGLPHVRVSTPWACTPTPPAACASAERTNSRHGGASIGRGWLLRGNHEQGGKFGRSPLQAWVVARRRVPRPGSGVVRRARGGSRGVRWHAATAAVGVAAVLPSANPCVVLSWRDVACPRLLLWGGELAAGPGLRVYRDTSCSSA